MKKTGVWVSIFMIISVLAGLVLPRFTLAWQDKKISAQVDEYEAQNVGLTYTNDVIDSLRLFSQGYEPNYDVPVRTIHTETEIMENAKDLLYRFQEYDINFADDIDNTIFVAPRWFPVLPANPAGAYSAVMWEIGIEDAERKPVIDFYFDDASGKMISFLWHFPEIEEETEQLSSVTGMGTDTEMAGQRQISYDTWGNVDMLLSHGISDFFREYYGLDSAMDSLFGENQDTYLEFTFTEEKYGKTIIPVWIYPDFFCFNPMGARSNK